MTDMTFDDIHDREHGYQDAHAQVLLAAERQERAMDALLWAERAGTGLEYIDILAAEMGLRNEYRKYRESHHP